MKILAIDPGTTHSAYVEFQDFNILSFGKIPNEELLKLIEDGSFNSNDIIAMEMIASYGCAVGKEVFFTCVWIGRFLQAWNKDWEYVYRKDVKMEICKSMKANDSTIRQALIDIFGGSKEAAIGTKSNPGPCYKISKDVWAALAVAVTFAERVKNRASTAS